MKYSLLLAALLTACGGGGNNAHTDSDVAAAPPASATSQPSSQAPVSTPAPTPSTEPSPSTTPSTPPSPTDKTPSTTTPQTEPPSTNLDPATSTAATQFSTCGYAVKGDTVTSKVVAVHDGDTLTLENGSKVRLDSIDAPELKQTYGNQSRDALSSLVLGQFVRVVSSKTDQYGRTIGAIFNPACVYVNLKQVQDGNAWVYASYRCEIPYATRTEFEKAQSQAKEGRKGLWQYLDALQPWVFRNGVDPTPPASCKDDPYTVPNYATSVGYGTSTPATSNGCSMVWVDGYRRSNGTYVNGYWRNSPGCG